MNTFINNDRLLIDEDVFKSMVPSSRNISDTQTIYYCISMSQNQTIKSILGKDLYEDIIDQYTDYVDSGVTMSDKYDELISNYLQPILSFSAYKRLINHLSFKLKEGGLRYSIDQTTELAQLDDRSVIFNEITNDINNFIKDMKIFIYDNQSYFPLYDQGFTGVVGNVKNLTIGKI